MDPRRRTRSSAANDAAATPTPPPPPPPPATDPTPSNDTAMVESTTPPGSPPRQQDDGFKLKFCTVCASNNNRSMESHLQLALNAYPVLSFGTGSLVRLPGPTITQPNVYNFNVTSYDAMYTELATKDTRLYRANGLLPMLDRNRHVKWGPERWQDWPVGVPRVSSQQKQNRGSIGTESGVVDIVITCEERCWDAVVEDLGNRGAPLNRPVHVVNVDIKDNHEEALVGGQAILDLANSLNAAARREIERVGEETFEGKARDGFDESVPEILAEWQERWPHLPALWTLAWF
ncbi:Ssu72-domain-containing protein [Microthyrium microscopicum]|uniref:RNA polymerase II subunit A C-terminal domain phosphatase SSU72 n=1 Tax=Microthyrium microscopicum TaxID=703497 RepID=A0A6A6U327_9PEZI|nr:Ssu72-domain-containing protein [Microthyrium microscopicum]